MEILAIYAVKGGVGKTTAAVNLSYRFAREARRTLLIDLDAQGAAGYYLKSRAKKKFSPGKLLDKKQDLRPFIRHSGYENLDILPSKGSFRNLDLHLDKGKNQSARLRKILKHLEPDYDLVVLDCPPTMTLLAENVFDASDRIFIPLVPTPLSVRTLDQVIDYFEKENLEKKKIFTFFSMVERRKNVHKSTMEYIRNNYGNILSTPIPRSADAEKMGIRREPIQCFAPRNTSALAFRELGLEILKLIG